MTKAYEVLIVDDEEIVCRGLAQFVKWEEHGFRVAGAVYSVDEALNFLERHPVDVVFLDIRMPKKTGLDMLKVMHSEYPETKAVILSGFSEFSYAREAVRYGAADYLTKPVNLKEVEGLLDRLREEFVKRRQDNAVRSSRVEGLLLSAARGYGEVKAEDYGIAVPEQWYGLAVRLLDRELSEQEIGEKKAWFRQMAEGVVPEAIVLNNEAYGLFAVIPCRGEEEAEYFIEILEQSADMKKEWPVG